MSLRRRIVTTLVAGLTAALTIPAASSQAAVSSGAASAPANSAETRRVDRVPTPSVDWFDCSVVTPRAECGTVRLPLDYDRPRGATTEVALLRIRAASPQRRIGTLFLNPGGPGGSGVEFASYAPLFLSPEILERFDVVGFDPRGVNFSANVRCWANFAAQAKALAGMSDTPFPLTRTETSAYVSSAVAFGRACSTTGRPLSAHMSTAQVVRDMDVLRRTFGDQALSFLGFSYGSYLGQAYANMFPGRVRAVAIDGVLDPIGWAGTPANQGTPQTQRIRSGEGAAKALAEILQRCRTAGPAYCMLAGEGDPQEIYDKLSAALKKAPLEFRDPYTGEVEGSITYQIMIAILLMDLYTPGAGAWVDSDLTMIWTMFQENSTGSERRAAIAKLKARMARLHPGPSANATALREAGAKAGWDFPYDNSPEAFETVLCTDSRNPRFARDWTRYAAKADATAPGFGPLWTWSSSPCASSTWTVRDTTAYRGPFDRMTAKPVLVVGNYWDPATNYAGAVKAASLLPNSRLLSSDSWGHTAYGTSECVTGAVDTYLLRTTVPRPGTRCRGDVQPFTVPLEEAPSQRRLAPARPLPPVVPPLPGSTPRH